MERHLRALGIKFILVSVVILSLYGIFYQLTFNQLLFFSIVTTGIAYGIGDVMIYPRLGNLWSTAIDALMYFAMLWTLSSLMITVPAPITLAAIAATYFLTIAEPLFHTYMKERVYELEDDTIDAEIPLGQLQVEMSEEFDNQRSQEDKREDS